MKWTILLICLIGGFSYWAEATVNHDQDNFQWVNSFFNGNTNSRAGCDTCECGKAKVERNPVSTHRIVGGQEAKKHSHPWLVSLLYKPKEIAYCGGSIINSKHILTAAHCNVVPMDDISVRTNVHRLDDVDIEEYAVEAIMAHESYNITTKQNDIAVYRLATEIDFSDNGDRTVMPICFSKPNDLFVGKMATVAGWGRIKYKGDQADKLLEADVPVVSEETCQKSLGKNRIKPEMMCAGYEAGGIDACEGDSGGPLILYDDETGSTHQIALVSFGRRCAYPKFYGVYTRTSSYKDWIDTQMVGGCSCKTT